jgi:Kef-type K+ transport system membrane component KefB
MKLTNRLITLGVLFGLAAIVILSPASSMGRAEAEETFSLGFILLFAYYLASILKDFKLPMISSYILAGVVCGPYVINLLSERVVVSLQLFDDMALAIIALVAGGEMKLRVLSEKRKAFLSLIVAQVAFSFVGAAIVIFLAKGRIGFLAGAPIGAVAAVALILGVVTAARSPATTIGVVTETRAKGPLTELIVGVTVILDVIILVLVAFVVPLASLISDPSASFTFSFAKDLILEVVGSIGVGILLGITIGSYIRWVGEFLPLFLVGAGFIGSMICRFYNFEPLLAFMVAGFFVENFSYMGDDLIKALEKSAFPVYVVFFAISGASINLDALARMWHLAIVLVVMRAAAFYAGSLAASRVSLHVKPFARSIWMGFLPQAGVTIGIASIVGRRFQWGDEVKTIILAVVALNQLIGPVALKLLLVRKGEGSDDRR